MLDSVHLQAPPTAAVEYQQRREGGGRRFRKGTAGRELCRKRKESPESVKDFFGLHSYF